ncbi:MAG: chorismate-binding protein [Bdellovibrionales bacterium]|nr:chorismate-binding protein [Bdellovibrionales bacterium]
MLRDIEKKDLESLLDQGAVLSDSNSLWLFWGDSHSQSVRPAGPAIFEMPFFSEAHIQWRVYENVARLTMNVARALFPFNKSILPQVKWQPADRDLFSQQFAWVKNQIQDAGIKKLVPYTLEKGSMSSIGPEQREAFIGRALTFSQGYLYGRWEGEKGYIGRTPEVLIEQSSPTEFSTMALAGTVPLSEYELNPNSFEKDPKQSDEHQWVVDDIANVLSHFGDVHVSERKVAKTPSLAHLQTNIKLVSRQSLDLESLIIQLHPTPALGAYPREKGLAALKQLDGVLSRDELGAPFGLSFNPNKALVLVGIRKLQWEHNNIQIASGCGVVQSSELESEWQELMAKRNSVKNLFGVQ